jgi:general secretion pathway protein B
MSYILEALKKAQAERQLGATPGLDSAPVVLRHASPEQSNTKWIALALAGMVFGAVAFYMATRPPADLATGSVAPMPAPAPVSRPVELKIEPAPVRQEEPVAVARPKAAPAPAPAAKPVPAPPVATPDPDESLPLQAQLPHDIQQSLPAVSFGGYMYSSNPADRLILIDKVLRKEGDSVAPGLILERLLPKCAVLNYRGTRYRVPY